uniref:Nectin cell adhesion molecule 4a n=1 Tax=Sander lucioperca TaxID=283035 RepID=A0A8D0DAE4_SANLU
MLFWLSPFPLLCYISFLYFVDLPSEDPIRSLAEVETTLPCRYQPTGADTVVQVTWYKEKPDATKEQIITAHFNEGQTGQSVPRVRFKSTEPTVDSSLIILSTEVSDEGKYVCRVITYPAGNFDREMSLIVWTVPISTLDPVILVEGQSFQPAATCRSIAHPPPQLSWDTDLNGQSTNRSSDNGAVSSYFSLHPLRSMNGKKLDCLVWHPTLKGPRRFSNKLVVHFPPHAEVSGYNGDWSVGMENAALRCVSGGNPKPQSFTWTRYNGGQLPEGVIPHPNGTLVFGRPLDLSDGGTYLCVAKNDVGQGKVEVEISVTEKSVMENKLMIIVGCVAGGLLILMLIIIIAVTCHHKRRNKKLEKELTVRKYEAHCRDSRSTISGGRGGGVAFDYLGRPVLHNNSRKGRDRLLDREEENRSRVESYVRNSAMSLVSQETRFHPPLTPSTFPKVQSTDVVRQLNGSAIIPSDGGSRPGSVTKNHQHPPLSSNYPPVTDDEDEVDEGLGGPASQEHPDDQDSETNSSQVSEAHSTRYLQTNGTLRPKPRPSLAVVSPHASLIHKAQIV